MAKKVRTAATMSPLDSIPAEMSPRLPVRMPVPSLRMTKTPAAAIDASAVLDCPAASEPPVLCCVVNAPADMTGRGGRQGTSDLGCPDVRAIRLTAGGEPRHLSLEDLPVPKPAGADALVRVHAAAITRDELTWPVDRLPATPSY